MGFGSAATPSTVVLLSLLPSITVWKPLVHACSNDSNRVKAIQAFFASSLAYVVDYQNRLEIFNLEAVASWTNACTKDNVDTS